MARLTNAALGRLMNPPLTGQQVGRLRRRGMPGDPAGAAEWRSRNLDPRHAKLPAVAPSARRPDIADAFQAAGVDMVASLVVNLGATIRDANIAVSGIGLALGDAAERLGLAGADALTFIAGPLSGPPPPAEADRMRAAIAARIAEMRAELAADD